MLDSIRQAGNDYYNALPHNIVRTVGLSAVASFTVSVLNKTNGIMDVSRPLLVAGVAAMASTIHALTAPLFKEVFGTWDGYIFAELSKMVVVSVIASAAVNALSNSSQTSLTKFILYSAISGNLARAVISLLFSRVGLRFNVDNSEYLQL